MDRSVAHPDYLSYRVKRLYLLLAQRIDDGLKPYGIGRSQYQVLSRVAREGTLTQKDLQHAMHIEAATLTCIVDVLAAKGWLERLESPDDKRVRVLLLTDDGRDKLARIPDQYEAVEVCMLSGVPDPDRATARALLEAMILNLEDRS
jgi:DNA-binding MarR family transcriptional regulator